VDNKAYPEIAEDYERMWRVLKSLPCDIFLGAHGSYFGLDEKYPLMKGEGANPFVDPSGYKKYLPRRNRNSARNWQNRNWRQVKDGATRSRAATNFRTKYDHNPIEHTLPGASSRWHVL